MPEHDTIQHADTHEPKHITTSSTSDTGKVITPSGTTSGTSELRTIKATELDTTGGANGEILTIVSGVPAWQEGGGSLFGDMDFRDNAVETTISSASVAVLVTGATLTTPAALFSQGVVDTVAFSNAGNNEKLTVPIAGVYEVSISASIQGTSASAKDYLFGIAVNGIPVANHARARRTTDSATRWGALSISEYVSLAADDDLQIFAVNETDSTNIVIGECSFNTVLLKAS